MPEQVKTLINKTDNFYNDCTKYVKQEPYVGEDGIYVPVNAYVPEGRASIYTMLMSKEMFIEAYNKYIKGEENEK